MAAKADQILLKIIQKKQENLFFIPPNKEDGEKKMNRQKMKKWISHFEQKTN